MADQTSGAVAVIPARGGSKRLPRKNLLAFRARPMIAWTIDAARASGVFDAVYVTTENKEIGQVAGDAGATVLKRDVALAADDVPLVAVLEDTLRQLGREAERACLLMPNCPLRNADDIAASANSFAKSEMDVLMSVVAYDWRRPQWALRDDGGRLTPVGWREPPKPTDVPERLVCPSGAIRWVWRECFLADPCFYPDTLAGFALPWYRGVDIDDAEDLEFAECVAFAMDRGFTFGAAA